MSTGPVVEWHCQCNQCVTTTHNDKLAPLCRHCGREMVQQDTTEDILRRIKAGGK